MTEKGGTREVMVVGDLNVDFILEVSEQPTLARLAGSSPAVRGRNLHVGSGGAAANTAMALAKLGNRVGFFGVVGKDMFGELACARLSDAGIDISQVVVVDGVSTGLVFRFESIASGTVIYSSPGPATVNPTILDLDSISAARVLYISGNIMTQSREMGELIRSVVRTGRDFGATIVLDPGRFWLDTRLAFYVEEVARMANVLLPNLHEAQLLTGEKDALEAGQKLLSNGADWVVVKTGNQGCVAGVGSEWFKQEAFAVEAVSTFGAGDAFNAGIIHGLVRGWSLRRVVRFATALACLKVTRRGTQEGLPSESEVDEMLQNQTSIARDV